MPRRADPDVRAALVAAATRLLAGEGRQALSTRRLAAEVGTSTMAVYTHFGSMERLQHEVRREGFARLCGEIDAIARTEDPVADLAAVTLAYVEAGTRDPQLYRALFVDRPPGEPDEGSGVFERLLAAVQRCIEAGRFQPAEPTLARAWAGQIWMSGHGVITLAQTGMLSEDANRFLLTDMIHRLAIGYGDGPAAAGRSIRHAADASPRAGVPSDPPR